mmetsp:Transcript_9103/g.11213  ORF Transcript_9103/g.11213 Transcript_9103/m.11213 type:complete len:191 (+) Transcript_9103:65-637(+)
MISKTMMVISITAPLYLFCILSTHMITAAFHIPLPHHRRSFTLMPLMSSSEPIEIMVRLPPTQSALMAQLKVQPVLTTPSEFVEVRYNVPFGLAVEPKNNMAVVTTDGPNGEKVGDILRYTSMWSMGLPRGDGILTTAASFSGSIGWQCSLFDVMGAKKWDEVVEALTSNVPSRTDEVVLLFERPLPAEE